LTIVAIVVLVVYWGALFVATHTPDIGDGQLFQYADKVAHACAYALLAWMAAMVLRVFHWPLRWICVCVFVVCATYGAIDEWLQQYTKRRSDINDWLADIIGITVGLTLFLLTHRVVRWLYHWVIGDAGKSDA
jgi:VanZ family protein